jgi:hypothetical protein
VGGRASSRLGPTAVVGGGCSGVDAAGGREVVAGGEASASGWWLGAGAPAVKTAREPAGRQVARGGIA